MNDVRPMYVQVRSDEWERMKNELQELRGDKAQLEETIAVLQLNAKDKSAKDEEIEALYQKSLARSFARSMA